MRLHITCPNCGMRAFSSHLRQLSPLVTEIVTPITSVVEHTLTPVTNILHGLLG